MQGQLCPCLSSILTHLYGVLHAESLRKPQQRRPQHGDLIGWSIGVTGAKAFISGGGVSSLYLIMARTSQSGAKGISAFLVAKVGSPCLIDGVDLWLNPSRGTISGNDIL